MDRARKYAENERLFGGGHAEAWQGRFDELCKRLRKRNRHIDVVLNYHQLLSKKTADFVCGDPPIIETEGDTDALMAALRRHRFFTLLYECMIDVSRYGNAVAKVVGDRMTIVPPGHWFPIVNRTDLKRIERHVIAFPVNNLPACRFSSGGESGGTALYAEIHDAGLVETRVYAYEPNGARDGVEAGEIGELIEARQERTGLNDFAVQPLTNVTHSGSVYGTDDYAAINSVVRAIMWRLHCAGGVMDKHSEPTMSGPSSALARDPRSGLSLFETGNYFKRDSLNDPDISYVTWNGNLDASFKEIEALLNQLYIMSEMGAAFLESHGLGGVQSAAALKLRLVSPRAKAKRVAELNDAPVRALLCLLATANGLDIDPDKLNIIWKDGIPSDPGEDAARRSLETGGKPTKSQFSAIKERGLSDAEVWAELEQMRAG
jgi:hypothetical protein